MILEHEVFSAFGLIVKLCCQLHVLNHSELRSTLQLVLIRHRVLHAHLSYLHEHVLPQLVNLLDPITLNAFNQIVVHGFLVVDLVFPLLKALLLNTLVHLELPQISILSY